MRCAAWQSCTASTRLQWNIQQVLEPQQQRRPLAIPARWIIPLELLFHVLLLVLCTRWNNKYKMKQWNFLLLLPRLHLPTTTTTPWWPPAPLQRKKRVRRLEVFMASQLAASTTRRHSITRCRYSHRALLHRPNSTTTTTTTTSFLRDCRRSSPHRRPAGRPPTRREDATRRCRRGAARRYYRGRRATTPAAAARPARLWRRRAELAPFPWSRRSPLSTAPRPPAGRRRGRPLPVSLTSEVPPMPCPART